MGCSSSKKYELPVSEDQVDVATADAPSPAKVQRSLTAEQLEARAAAAVKRAANSTSSQKETLLRKAMEAEADAAALVSAKAIMSMSLDMAAAAEAEEKRLAQERLAEEQRAAEAAQAAAQAAQAKAEAEAAAETARALVGRKPSEKAVETWTKKLVMALSNKSNALGVSAVAKGTGIGVNAIEAASQTTETLAQHFVRGADANKMLNVMGERQSPRTAAKRYKTTEMLQAALDHYEAHKDDLAFLESAWKLQGPE